MTTFNGRSPEERAAYFWSKVAWDGPIPTHVPELGPCAVWTGATDRGGYGRHGVRHGEYLAHRIASTLTDGPIPPGIRVLHKCDNPPCVRPDHLFRGTLLDNTHDMLAKGRANKATGDRHSSRTHPETIRRGERHPFAKLTYASVAEIRERAAAGASQERLGREFGVAQSSISLAVRGLRWK